MNVRNNSPNIPYSTELCGLCAKALINQSPPMEIYRNVSVKTWNQNSSISTRAGKDLGPKMEKSIFTLHKMEEKKKEDSDNHPRRGSDILKRFFQEGSELQFSESLNPEDIAEITFLEKFKHELQISDLPFLENTPRNSYLSEQLSQLHHKNVVPSSDPNPLVTVIGPKDTGIDHEEFQVLGDILCAATLSTYPLRSDSSKTREGDPICDRYGFYLYPNRSLAVVADGCNWGERPKRAAERARNTVMAYLKERNTKIKTLEDAKLYLLRSFNEAHRRICEKSYPEEEIGSTTVLAGVTLELLTKNNNNNNEFAFVCASVGDCKAFKLDVETLTIRDITAGNRAGQTHSGDCGGRLGPVMPDGGPDLRNLQTYSCTCVEGDIIMLMSDGVHDNLHPEMLGISPRELKLDFDDWKNADPSIDVDDICNHFRTKLLKDILGEMEYNPKNIVHKVLKHALETTKSSREFMEQNPGKRLPKDYHKYPGKMDHTTIICFRVGYATSEYPRSSKVKESPIPCIPISVTLAKDETHFTIYCRTIAKGKFECIAKKTECILTVSPKKTLPYNDLVVFGADELSQPISRVVKIPPGISINIHSKQISYNSEFGLISIKFALSDV